MIEQEFFSFSFLPPNHLEEQLKAFLVKAGITEEERQLKATRKWLIFDAEVIEGEEFIINHCDSCHHCQHPHHYHHHHPNQSLSSPPLSLFSLLSDICVYGK